MSNWWEAYPVADEEDDKPNAQNWMDQYPVAEQPASEPVAQEPAAQNWWDQYPPAEEGDTSPNLITRGLDAAENVTNNLFSQSSMGANPITAVPHIANEMTRDFREKHFGSGSGLARALGRGTTDAASMGVSATAAHGEAKRELTVNQRIFDEIELGQQRIESGDEHARVATARNIRNLANSQLGSRGDRDERQIVLDLANAFERGEDISSLLPETYLGPEAERWVPPEERAAYRVAERIEEWGNRTFQKKDGEEGFGYDVVQSMPTLLMFMGVSSVTGPTGSFTLAGLMGQQETYDRGRIAGLSPLEAMERAHKGIPAGMMQAAPAELILGRIPGLKQIKELNTFWGKMSRIGLAFGGEAFVENSGAIWQNLIDAEVNDEVNWHDGTPYQGMVSGTGAALIQAAFIAAAKRGATQGMTRQEFEAAVTQASKDAEQDLAKDFAFVHEANFQDGSQRKLGVILTDLEAAIKDGDEGRALQLEQELEVKLESLGQQFGEGATPEIAGRSEVEAREDEGLETSQTISGTPGPMDAAQARGGLTAFDDPGVADQGTPVGEQQAETTSEGQTLEQIEAAEHRAQQQKTAGERAFRVQRNAILQTINEVEAAGFDNEAAPYTQTVQQERLKDLRSQLRTLEREHQAVRPAATSGWNLGASATAQAESAAPVRPIQPVPGSERRVLRATPEGLQDRGVRFRTEPLQDVQAQLWQVDTEALQNIARVALKGDYSPNRIRPVEASAVRQGNVLLPKGQRVDAEGMTALGGLYEALGHRVVFYRDTGGKGGLPGGATFRGSEGTLYVNVASSVDLMSESAHELVHQMRVRHQGAYKTYLQALQATTVDGKPVLDTSDPAMLAWVQEYASQKYDSMDALLADRARPNESRGQTRDRLVEEMVADATGVASRQPGFWNQVFENMGRQDRTALQKFVDVLTQMIDAMKSASFQAIQPHINDMTALRDAAAQFLASGGTYRPAPGQNQSAILGFDGTQGANNVQQGRAEGPAADAASRRGATEEGADRQDAVAGRSEPGAEEGGPGANIASSLQRGKGKAGEVSLVGIHYSKEPRTELRGEFYSTGMLGAERQRVMSSTDPRLKSRVYVYVNEGQGVAPESGVGANAHAVPLENLYDVQEDPHLLWWTTNGDLNVLETSILDLGYDGLYSRAAFRTQGVAYVMGPAAESVMTQPVDSLEAGVTEISDTPSPYPGVEDAAARITGLRGRPGIWGGKVEGTRWRDAIARADPEIAFEMDALGVFNTDELMYLNDLARAYVLAKVAESPAESPADVAESPARITVDGVERPTTNSLGQPIHPTEGGVRNFWKWFGESRVVDEQGRPMVMYHGTHADFTEFLPNDALGGLIFAAESAAQASAFAFARGANVMPIYLKVENPAPGVVHAANEATAALKAKKKGYDAVRMRDSASDVINWGVFSPAQIKSATGNRGTFDGTEVDIRHSPSRAPARNRLRVKVRDEALDLSNIDILYNPDYEAPAANSQTKSQVAYALHARGLETLKRLGIDVADLSNPDLQQIVAESIAAEIDLAMQETGHAATWYSDKIIGMMGVASLIHPELKSDPGAQAAFLMAVAITSQNSDVVSNIQHAEEVYAVLRKNKGRFLPKGWGTASGQMRKNFRRANELFKQYSPDQIIRFLNTEFTVGELKRAGWTVAGELTEQKVYGSAIFGPKIGNGFYQNINGNFSPLTMDMWFMRAMGRLTGDLMEGSQDLIVRQTERFLSELDSGGAFADGRTVDWFAEVEPRGDQDLGITEFTPENVKSDYDVMLEMAHRINAWFTKDYTDNRAKYDSKKYVKPQIVLAAQQLLHNANPKDSPQNGKHRVLLRETFARTLSILKEAGVDLSSADGQALWWFPEKDLYGKMGYRVTRAKPTDYEQEMRKLAKERGHSEATIQRSVRNARERARRNARRVAGKGRGTEATDRPSLARRERNSFLARRVIGRERRTLSYTRKKPRTARTGPTVAGRRLPADVHQIAKQATRNALNQIGVTTPEIFELHSSIEAAQAFAEAITEAKSKTKAGQAVSVYPAEEYAGMRLFVTEDGQAGFALNGDDIISVFNVKGSQHRGWVVPTLLIATQQGGRRLDAFDVGLPEAYSQVGFRAVSRTPWSDEAARDMDWDYKYWAKQGIPEGRPDVVFMVFDPAHSKNYQPGDGRVFRGDDGYGKASARQKREAKKVKTVDQSEFPEFSPQRSPLGFYSALAEAVQRAPAKLDSAKAGQWKVWIQANAGKLGVKADEIQWSGVLDYLDMQDGPVSSTDISAYLEQGGVQVEEVVLGESDFSGFRAVQLRDLIEESAEARERHEGTMLDEETWIVLDREGNEVGQQYGDEAASPDEAFSNWLEDIGRSGDTSDSFGPRYREYTIPGGIDGTYREVLLTLPDRTVEAERNLKEFHSRILEKYGDQFEDRATAVIQWKQVATKADISEHERLTQEYERTNDWYRESHKSPHWDTPNVLAHMRLDDRTGPNGERTMFVQEVQSDWGQEGRKKGFSGQYAAYKVHQDKDGSFYVEDDGGSGESGFKTRDEAQTWADRENARDPSLVPPAPFVTSTQGWVNLALKRAMVMAAEGGYDQVAFATGEQSAELYSLDKRLGEIVHFRDSAGEIGIEAVDPDGFVVIKEYPVSESLLADIVGKELAQKIINGEGETKSDFGYESDANQRFLRGDNLKIEAKGMRDFYDKILPQAMNKILKPFGQKVGAVRLNTPRTAPQSVPGFLVRAADDAFNKGVSREDAIETMMRVYELEPHQDVMEAVNARYDDVRNQQPAVTITPEMRQTIGEQGLPMFSPQRFPIQESDRRRMQRKNQDGPTSIVSVDASRFQEMFEEARGEPLAWNHRRTSLLQDLLAEGTSIDAYPRVGVLFNSKTGVDVSDGRHRIALAALRGENIDVSVPRGEVEDFINRLGEESATVVEGTDDDMPMFSPTRSTKVSKAKAEELEAGEKVTLYRAMTLIDGKLYPPMSSRMKGESGRKLVLRNPEPIGEWQRSEERPELVPTEGPNKGMFPLKKSHGDTTWALYAPYFHTSALPLNDQFTAAYLNDGVERPQIVTVEVEVPVSEQTSGYQAEGSVKSVGPNTWNSGTVASKIPGGREVFLSRYLKIKRIVPDAEAAQKIAEIVNPNRLQIPENVVTPQLRKELEKQGVRIAKKGTSGDDIYFSKPRPPAQGEPQVNNRWMEIAKLRGLFESVPTVLRDRAVGLGGLANDIEKFYEDWRKHIGTGYGMLFQPLRAIERLPSDQGEHVYSLFERYNAAMENGRNRTAENIYQNNGQELRDLIDAWDQFAQMSGDMNQAAGVQVYDPALGQFRLIGKVKRFWPRVLNEATQDAIDNPTKNAETWARWNQMVNELIANGNIADADEAARFIRAYTKRSQDDYFGGLEKARVGQLPESFYDYGVQTGITYVEQWARHLSRIETFGQKTTPDSKNAFDRARDSTSHKGTEQYLTAIENRVFSEKDDTAGNRALQRGNAVATAIHLGNPATAALNMIGGSALSFMAFGVVPTLHGAFEITMRMMMSNPKRAWNTLTANQVAASVRQGRTPLKLAGVHARQTWRAFKDLLSLPEDLWTDMVEEGILRSDYMQMQQDMLAMGLDGKGDRLMSKAVSLALKAGGYTPAEYFIRANAALAGRYQLRTALGHWNSNIQSRKSRNALAWFQRAGFDTEKLIREGGKGEESSRYILWASNLTNGTYQIDQTPVWIDTPVGRTLAKYQKFLTQVNRLYQQQFWRPMVASLKGGESVTYTLPNGQKVVDKAGRFKPFMDNLRFFLVPALAYNLLLAPLRENLFGYIDPAPGDDEIIKLLQDDEIWGALMLTFEKAFVGVLGLGALGMFGNYGQMLYDVADRNRVKSPLDPPALAPLVGLGHLILTGFDQADKSLEKTDPGRYFRLTARDFEQFFRQQLSAYRTGKAIAVTTSDKVGSEWREAQLEVFRRDRAYTKKMTRRYAADAGIFVKRRTQANPGSGPMTPINRSIVEELVLGNPTTARLIAEDHLRSIKDWRQREAAWSSMVSAIRSYEPARLSTNMAPSDLDRDNFLAWVKDRVSPENHERIRRVQDSYLQAAQQAGFREDDMGMRSMKEGMRRKVRGSVYGGAGGMDLHIMKLMGMSKN